MDYAGKARKIIADNLFLSLATYHVHPWIAPLYYAYDTKLWHFYFVSARDSLHVENIIARSDVAVAIYDSTAIPGSADGVQFSGDAYEVERGQLPGVLEVYYARRFPNPADRLSRDLSPGAFSGSSMFRFFRIVPREVFTLDPDSTKVDRRVKVEL
jgi:uncharacterized protein YhbP (UPF0306 family)